MHGLQTCDSCRKARRWLERAGIAYRFRDLRAEPLREAEAAAWLDALGTERLVNRRSTTWRKLDEAERERALGGDAAALLAAHPTLLKRPLIEAPGGPYVGFDSSVQAALAQQE